MSVELSVISEFMNMGSTTGTGGTDTSRGGEEESFSAVLEDSIKESNSGSDSNKAVESDNGASQNSETSQSEPERTDGVDEANITEKNSETSQSGSEGAEGVETTDNELKSINELADELGLTDDQLNTLAGLLGVSVEEVGEIEITVSRQESGKSAFVQALMPDGSEVDLSDLLGVSAEDAGLNSIAEETIGKIAEALGLDESQTKELFTSLKVSSIEVKVEANTSLKSEVADTINAPSATTEVKAGTDNSGNETDTSGKETPNEQNDISNNTAVNDSDANGADFESVVAKTGDSTAKTESQLSVKTTAQTSVDNIQSASVESAKSTSSDTTVAKNENIRAQRTMDQIVESARILSLPNRTHARISLQPGSLGSMEIRLTLQDAQVHGTITVDTPAAKEIIEQNINQLKDALNQQGISVEEFSVALNGENSHAFDANWAGKNRGGFVEGAYSSGDDNAAGADEPAVADDAAIRKAMFNRVVDIKA